MFRISGFGFRVSCLGFLVSGLEFWVSGFGFRVSGFGLRAVCFVLWVLGFGFRDRVSGGTPAAAMTIPAAEETLKVSCLPHRSLIQMSIHHEHDFPQGIGAFLLKTRLTAPMSWGGIVFMMDSSRD